MWKLLGVELQDVVYFKKARVSLTKSPLIFVRGLNLDSDPANPTSNGAGKTLLFSTIANVLFFSTPLAIKKKARKDILGKGSHIALTFKTHSGDKYKIKQMSSKYVIERNGEDLGVTKIPIAEQMIRDLFPMSETLFYSTAYVSTQRPFPFQQDSDSARLEHLVDMFRLDQFDRMREYFARKHREAKDSEAKLSILEQRLLVLKDKLKVARGKHRKTKQAGMRDNLVELEAGIKRLEKEQHELNVQMVALRTLRDTEKELDKLRGRYTHSGSPKDVRAWLKEQRTSVRAYDKYLSLKAQYDESVRSTNEELESLKLPKRGADDLRADRQSAKEALKALESELDIMSTQRSLYDSVVSRGKELATLLLDVGVDVKHGDTVDLKEDIESQLSVYRATLQLEELVDHDHEGNTTCPTCLNEIDVKTTREAIRAAKKAIPRLKQRASAQRRYRDYLDLKAQIKKIKYDARAHELAKAERESLDDHVQRIDDNLRVWSTEATLRKTLKSIVPPEKVGKPETKLTAKQIDEEIELCSDILQHLEAKSKLVQAHPSLSKLRKVHAINSEVASVKEQLEAIDSKLLGLRKSLADITGAIEAHTNLSNEIALYESEITSIDSEITALRPEIAKKRLLEVLLKAYGAKGLRTLAANDICGLIEANLNHYRGLVFLEPFVFSVQASETGLSIKVDRGNKMAPSDVRTLSGAESNFFRLLFVLSVLPLLPDDRRTNFLILDEPTSHTDDVSRTVFRERFLPAIQEIVPHTIVISPHSDDYCEGGVEWLVKKHNGVSEVITAAGL